MVSDESPIVQHRVTSTASQQSFVVATKPSSVTPRSGSRRSVVTVYVTARLQRRGVLFAGRPSKAHGGESPLLKLADKKVFLVFLEFFTELKIINS